MSTPLFVAFFLVSLFAVVSFAITLGLAKTVSDLRYQVHVLETSRDHWRRLAESRAKSARQQGGPKSLPRLKTIVTRSSIPRD